jgi:hypothetical protein
METRDFMGTSVTCGQHLIQASHFPLSFVPILVHTALAQSHATKINVRVITGKRTERGEYY